VMYPTLSGGERASGWQSLAALLGAALLCLYLVPLVALVVAVSPSVLLGGLTDPAVTAAATTSVAAALTSTALAGLFGVPLAYWLARTESRLGRVALVVVVLPLVLPPVVSGMLLVGVAGRGGLLGGVGLTRSFGGIVLAQTFVASPLVVVTARTAFRRVDDELRETARTLGCTPAGTFRRVGLPLAWPGIVAGLALGFARAMGEFGATMLLAYYPRTLPVQVWVSFTTRGTDAAFPVALVLLVVSVAVLAVVTALGTLPRT
jgi:molybdate/tungstate transport system permease protein